MSNMDLGLATTSSQLMSELPPRPHSTSNARAWTTHGWLVVALAVLAIAYGPLLWMFFYQQWQKPQYQFFPFVIGAFAWLLWTRWSESTPKISTSSALIWLARSLQVIAVAILLFALAWRSPWCAVVSLIALVAAIFASISSSRHVVNLWGIWLLLWLMLPAPLNLDQKLINRLQFVSSQLSSYVLDGVGVTHLMDGNTLTLTAKKLFVDEACSGIISMLSIVACAVIYSVVKNRSPLHLVLLTLASIAWATLINVIRISLIAVALDFWEIDWSSGAPHEILSLVLFLLAFLALLCTDQVLVGCLAPVSDAWDESYAHDFHIGRRLAAVWDRATELGQPHPITEAEASNDANTTATTPPAAQSTRQASGWFLPIIFTPIAVFQVALIVVAFVRAPDRLASVQKGIELTSDRLPATQAGLQKIDFQVFNRSADSINGKYSRTYVYRGDDGTRYMLSFDFPFPGYWHELTECYVAAGWQPIHREVVSATAGAATDPSWKFVDATFSKPGGQFGSLCFSEFDQLGVPFEPQSDWLNDRNSFWNSRNLYIQEQQIFQVQVWSEGASEWNPAQRKKAHELLLAARQQFRTMVIEPSPPVQSAVDQSPLPITTGERIQNNDPPK